MDDHQEPPTAQRTANEKFFRFFQHEVVDLQEQMDRLQSTGTSGGERADAVDRCLSGIVHLSNEVNDASSHLPAYDQRTYGEAIKALTTKLQEVRASLAPRPKFAFKNGAVFTARKNASAISLTDVVDEKRGTMPGYLLDSRDSSLTTTPAENDSVFSSDDDRPSRSSGATQPLTISHRSNTHFTLPPSANPTAPSTSSATLSHLHRTIIDLSPSTSTSPLATLTLQSITSSLLLLGRITGAAHCTALSHSTLVVASGQLRIHDSHDVDIYCRVASNPIIEGCSGLRFAPLPRAFLQAGSEGEEEGGKWCEVEDFNWLRREASPYWRVLGQGERVGEEVWESVVATGVERKGVEEILGRLGIAE